MISVPSPYHHPLAVSPYLQPSVEGTQPSTMLSLCQPYSPTITCLCDQGDSVLRCFLTTEEGDRENYMQEDTMVPVSMSEQGSAQCDRIVDMKTEIIIAAAIVLLILGIIAL